MRRTRNRERKVKYALMSKNNVPGKKEIRKGQRKVNEIIYLRKLNPSEVEVQFNYGLKIEPFESGVYAVKTGNQFQIYKLNGTPLSAVSGENKLETIVKKCAMNLASKLAREYDMKIRI